MDALYGYVKGHHIIYEDGIVEAVYHVKRWGRECGCGHPNCTGLYKHTKMVKIIEVDIEDYLNDHLSFWEAIKRYAQTD